jgi:hypothetical protein
MAFKNVMGATTNTGALMYTVPAGNVGILIGLNLANKTTERESVSVDINGVFLAKDIPLPAGSSVSLLDGKVVLEAGNSLTVSSTADNAVDVIISLMEQLA